jgi:hypothetical protein
MPQPLIIDHSKVNVGGKLLACDARVHWFVSIVVISSSTKLLAEVIYSSVRLRKSINMIRTIDERRKTMNSTNVKGVASCANPCMAPAFPAMLSTSIPMVMRLGKACGLIMTSGCIPLSLKGMSIAGHF